MNSALKPNYSVPNKTVKSSIADAISVAMITNIPAPYRLSVFEQLADAPGIDFCAFFCSDREPDREWNLTDSKFMQLFLRGKFVT